MKGIIGTVGTAGNEVTPAPVHYSQERVLGAGASAHGGGSTGALQMVGALTVRDIEHQARCSRRTALRLARLCGCWKVGGRLLVAEADWQRYLGAHRIAPQGGHEEPDGSKHQARRTSRLEIEGRDTYAPSR